MPKHDHARHVCFRCLNTSNSEKSLASPHKYFKSYEAIKIELREDGFKICFKNHNRLMRVSSIAYADFESFTLQQSSYQPNLEKSYTNHYQKHIQSGCCYYTKCFDDTLYSQQPVTFVKEFHGKIR